MNPKNLGFEDCDSVSLLRSLHEETQTNQIQTGFAPKEDDKPTNITDTQTLRLNKSLSIKSQIQSFDSSSKTALEFNQESNPKFGNNSVTTEINKPSDTISSKSRYCKDVIPYFKGFALGCPRDESLTQDSPDFDYDDFPDYQPCYEVFHGKKDIIEKISEKGISIHSFNSSEPSKVDVSTSYRNSDIFRPKMDSTNDENLSENASDLDTYDPKLEDPTEKTDVVSAYIIDKQETNHKPEIQAVENSIKVQTSQKDTSILESHLKAIATIKYAAEDIASKVYDKTKSTMSVIQTEGAKQFQILEKESAKHFETFKKEGAKHLETFKNEGAKHLETIKTESAKHLETLKKETAKHLDNMNKIKSSWSSSNTEADKKGSSIINFNMFRKIESKSSEKVETKSFNETVQDLAKAVDSQVTVLSQKISENWPDSLKRRDFNDCSSAYDVPNKKNEKPPKQVSNVIQDVPATNSVFSIIRNKIFALFSDPEKPADITIVSSSSSISSIEDNDKIDKKE